MAGVLNIWYHNQPRAHLRKVPVKCAELVCARGMHEISCTALHEALMLNLKFAYSTCPMELPGVLGVSTHKRGPTWGPSYWKLGEQAGPKPATFRNAVVAALIVKAWLQKYNFIPTVSTKCRGSPRLTTDKCYAIQVTTSGRHVRPKNEAQPGPLIKALHGMTGMSADRRALLIYG